MSATRSSLYRKASFLAAAYFGIVSFSLAQTSPARKSPESTATYGTTSLTSLTIQGYEFVGFAGSTTITSDGHGGRFPASGISILDTPVFVPAGAVIDHYELEACDTNVTTDIESTLWQCDDGLCTSLYSAIVPHGVGCARVSSTTGAATVDNLVSSYFLEVNFGAVDGTTVIRAARIFYKLQVSPGPAVATFADVPTTSPQFKFVEALVAAGITAGCGGGNYCPGNPVTRGQMAVFLSVALGLHFPN